MSEISYALFQAFKKFLRRYRYTIDWSRKEASGVYRVRVKDGKSQVYVSFFGSGNVGTRGDDSELHRIIKRWRKVVIEHLEQEGYEP